MAMETTLEPSAARRALRLAALPDPSGASEAELSVEPVHDGVNDLFVVGGPSVDGRLAVKFGTFSTPGHLRAGVGAYRLLDAYADLPVPTVHAFDPNPDDVPPFLVRDHLPGAPLPDGSDGVRSAAARTAVELLGAVVGEFGPLPDAAADGYGVVREVGTTESGPRAVADHDDCAEMLVEYATRLYADPPDNDALRAVAPAVPDHLRAERDRLPSSPDPAVVVTDLSPGNLLAPGGSPPDAGGGPTEGGPATDGLTGVIDLERAKIGPREFTAVNAEYLLTRRVESPELAREALYDALPFGPDVPARDLYRLVAMGRSVNALGIWYDPASEAYRRRGEELAAEIERLTR